jgi:hypothetical protein
MQAGKRAAQVRPSIGFDWMFSVDDVRWCLEAPVPTRSFTRLVHSVVGQKLMVFDRLDFLFLFLGFLERLEMDSMLHSSLLRYVSPGKLLFLPFTKTVLTIDPKSLCRQ